MWSVYSKDYLMKFSPCKLSENRHEVSSLFHITPSLSYISIISHFYFGAARGYCNFNIGGVPLDNFVYPSTFLLTTTNSRT